MSDSPAPLLNLTPRFQKAMVYAAQLHEKQWRKGSRVPYIAHLLSVASLVIEDGGDEDQAIAALLHDAVEDQGGRDTLDEVRARFGERVAFIVEGCTDSFETPKPPWRARKEAYIQRMQNASPEVVRVSLADKLHNARSILADLSSDGDSLWERFRGGKEGSLWYYRTLVGVYQMVYRGYLVEELDRLVTEIERRVKETDG